MTLCSEPHPIHGDARVCSLEPGHDGEHNNGTPPGAVLFQVTITATGEVRDADGNLVTSEPIESTMVLTEDEVASMKEHQP